MIEHRWNHNHDILVVHPLAPLSEEDFSSLAAQVDPVIAEDGSLSGLMIVATDFPGWKSFSALMDHLRFVRNHHRHIRKVAVVSDESLLKFMPRIVGHFVGAEVRPFPSDEEQEALGWLSTPG